MAIRDKFGQAIIGVMASDLEQALIQIHRPEINMASAYRPQDPAIERYLIGLDIEKRYMRPTDDNPHPEYGVEPAFFYYNALTHDLTIDGNVPEGEGRDQFLGHIKGGAVIYSQATGFQDVTVMWRVMGEGKRGLLCHIDNDVTLRGLETISGDARTLWLSDQYINWNNFECDYDEQGSMIGNCLFTSFSDHARLEQVDKHHMSIHKGGAFSNPLFHTAAGLCPELNMRPGTRSILTYDPRA